MAMSWDEEDRENRTCQFKMALRHQSGKAWAWGSMAWLAQKVQTRNHQCVDMVRLATEGEQTQPPGNGQQRKGAQRGLGGENPGKCWSQKLEAFSRGPAPHRGKL